MIFFYISRCRWPRLSTFNHSSQSNLTGATTQNAKMKFPVAYFTEGGRLGMSPDIVNPLLSLPGVYSFQERLRGRRGLFNEAKIVISFPHKELEPEVKNLRDMKLEVMISRELRSNGNFQLVNKPFVIN